MDIVVDASALIAVIANEPAKESLVELTEGSRLIAPASVHWEIGNAFSAMLKRRRTTFSLARKALDVYKTISIRFVDVEMEESLRIADRLGIYAYDAYLIRCSLKHHAPLLSLDGGLIQSASQMGAEIMEVPNERTNTVSD